MPHINFQALLEQAKKYPPIKTAVVHPVTPDALLGVAAAAQQQLIIPVLVGPPHKIQHASAETHIDISHYELIPTEHSHAAAKEAVRMARAAQVGLIMKGSLHTDELMTAVIDKDTGLRTAKRMSHVFIAEIHTYSKLLLLTDCALNICPNLTEKQDIIQNAIALAHALGIETPKVAILSAIETINDKLKSTIDAAALCKMADRGQITGAILDGPLGFDNAISKEAADIKGIRSPVAGDPDILLVPDLESGNMLAKQLAYLTQAQLAGIVLGARVPMVLTSRADHTASRLLSCAVAQLYSQFLQQKGLSCSPRC